jgi:hypothetical protein
MTLAAMKLPGEVGQRGFRQFGFHHFADQLLEAFVQFVVAGGF